MSNAKPNTAGTEAAEASQVIVVTAEDISACIKKQMEIQETAKNIAIEGKLAQGTRSNELGQNAQLPKSTSKDQGKVR
jgi:hypothetical protein